MSRTNFRNGLMRQTLGVVIAFLTVSHAAADQITISNKAGGTIYRVYAWPSDLIARTFNILSTPLQRSSEAVVNIDNSYQDCMFTFQYDLNNPADRRKRNYKRRALETKEVNICKNKGSVYLGYDF